MLRLTTFTRVAAIAMLICLNACKKDVPQDTITAKESNTATAARLGFTDYNRNLTFYALTTTLPVDLF